MRHLLTTASLFLCLSVGLAAGEAAADEAAALAAQRAFSEALGLQMSRQVEMMNLDPEGVLLGLTQGIKKEKPVPSDAEMQRIMKEFQKHVPLLQKLATKQWKAKQGLPAAVHDEFYQAFVKLEGVTVTGSGLAFQVLTPAEGAKPTAADTVRVHYTGRHTDGKIFDSSIPRGQPAVFPLGGVIKGWTEGLQLMPVGATYRFVIPAALAYGPLQEGSDKPTGILIFDVKLLEIVKR